MTSGRRPCASLATNCIPHERRGQAEEEEANLSLEGKQAGGYEGEVVGEQRREGEEGGGGEEEGGGRGELSPDRKTEESRRWAWRKKEVKQRRKEGTMREGRRERKGKGGGRREGGGKDRAWPPLHLLSGTESMAQKKYSEMATIMTTSQKKTCVSIQKGKREEINVAY